MERVGVIKLDDGTIKLPVTYVNELGEFLREKKRSNGEVITTYSYLAVTDGISIPMNLSMDIFSCHFLDTEKSRRVKIVNRDIMVEIIEEAQSEFIVTAIDEKGSPKMICGYNDDLQYLIGNKYKII